MSWFASPETTSNHILGILVVGMMPSSASSASMASMASMAMQTASLSLLDLICPAGDRLT